MTVDNVQLIMPFVTYELGVRLVFTRLASQDSVVGRGEDGDRGFSIHIAVASFNTGVEGNSRDFQTQLHRCDLVSEDQVR